MTVRHGSIADGEPLWFLGIRKRGTLTLPTAGAIKGVKQPLNVLHFFRPDRDLGPPISGVSGADSQETKPFRVIFRS